MTRLAEENGTIANFHEINKLQTRKYNEFTNNTIINNIRLSVLLLL